MDQNPKTHWSNRASAAINGGMVRASEFVSVSELQRLYRWVSFGGATIRSSVKCKILNARAIVTVLHFTCFDKKNTHISGCKIVHKCTSTTVTMISTRSFAAFSFFGQFFKLVISFSLFWLVYLIIIRPFSTFHCKRICPTVLIAKRKKYLKQPSELHYHSTFKEILAVKLKRPQGDYGKAGSLKILKANSLVFTIKGIIFQIIKPEFMEVYVYTWENIFVIFVHLCIILHPLMWVFIFCQNG